MVMMLAIASFVATRADAQRTGAHGSLSGEVYDSVHRRPLAGAMVTATPRNAESGSLPQASTDRRGRFNLAVPQGEYEIRVFHPWLDSTSLTIPSRSASVGADARVQIALAVPSPMTLRRSICGKSWTDSLTGAIAGIVRSSETDRPIANAAVVFQLTEIGVDRSDSVRIRQRLLTAQVTTDSVGVFRACGLPLHEPIALQAQADSAHQSGIVEAMIGDPGIAFVTVLVSERAHALSPPDSARIPAETASGHVVTGVVQSEAGQPVPRAQVRLVGHEASTTAGEDGRYRLRGVPAGSQGLEFAAIGFYPRRGRVDVASVGTAVLDMRLRRLSAVMDTIRIMAMRTTGSRLLEFEERRARRWAGTSLRQTSRSARRSIRAVCSTRQ